jgi:hypothetical protein
MKNSILQPLIETIYNGSLTKRIFSSPWDELIMTLLPKKVNPNDIRNYKPISLVNTDYKVFTPIINQRFMNVSSQLINEFQLGFVPGRYIAENGMTAQIIIEDARLKN